MTSLAEDQVHLLRALVRCGVEFVVIGGVAAQVHGWQGATADLDVAVSRAEVNIRRLNTALATVGAGQPIIGGLGTIFQTRYGRLEIVRRADGVGDYADWLRRAQEHEVEEGLTIVVAAIDDILHSKEAAGREKDLAAIPQMRKDFANASSSRSRRGQD